MSRFRTEREADGRWLAEDKEHPGVMAYGKTQAEAEVAVRELAERVAPEPPAPLHPIEIRISIGAEDWDYVRMKIREWYMEEDGLPLRSGFGGGAGGSYSVTIAHRDVTKEQFREELGTWRKNLK